MLFPTVDFAVFFVLVFTGSWLLRPRKAAWRWFILLASCVFYLDPFNVTKSFVVWPALAAIIAMALLTVGVTRAIAPGDAGPGSNRGSIAVGGVIAVLAAYVAGNVWLHGAVTEKPDQSWVWLFLLLGIAFVNQAFAKAVYVSMGEGRSRTAISRRLVQGAVVVNLATLGIFKYYGWFRDSFEFLFSLPFLELALPIAISFFTFQAISYVIDVGRGAVTHPAAGLLRLPELLRPPRRRPDRARRRVRPAARPARRPPVRAFRRGVRADRPRHVQEGRHLELGRRRAGRPHLRSARRLGAGDTSRFETLMGVLGYAIQIYADFSGYTDIAIGLALLLGIRFPQNFDQPYRSLSIQDFWRRWHMTLSRWMRDYLYIPLGGNRRGVERTYVNLWLTMVLGGIWHGANWTFVIWGAIHGTALAVERFTKLRWAQRPKPVGLPPGLVSILQWTLTFTIVCGAWVFFRASSAGDAFAVFGLMFTSDAPTPADAMATLWLGLAIVVASVAVQFLPEQVGRRAGDTFSRLAPALQIVALAVGLVVIDALGPEGIAPFIYFQF
ncbi:MAG: MBOAT family O-acyltransferase [Acidimicrobiales bacterium]